MKFRLWMIFTVLLMIQWVQGQELFSTENEKGKWGFVDSAGQEVIPFVYDKADCFYMGYSSVAKNGKTGLIDMNGKVVVPIMYDNELIYFEEDLALVVKDDLYGFVDKNGHVSIPLIYEDAKDFKDGKAEVMKDGEWIYIDANGQKIAN